MVLLLADVNYDGLLETPLWVDGVRLTPVKYTLGFVLPAALFLGTYLSFFGLSRSFGGGEAVAGWRRRTLSRSCR